VEAVPEAPALLTARRLEDVFDISADVDYAATLEHERHDAPVRRAHEGKSSEWKPLPAGKDRRRRPTAAAAWAERARALAVNVGSAPCLGPQPSAPERIPYIGPGLFP
jgi:hypothetical protein